MIAIKWGESTHFPGRIDPGRTGNRGKTTHILMFTLEIEVVSRGESTCVTW